MRTTLEISDNRFSRAQKLGEREGKTFEDVIEEALITRLEACERAITPYVLQIPVVSGEIASAFRNAPWEKVRDEFYAYRFTNFALIADSIQPVKTAKRSVTSPKAQKVVRVVKVVMAVVAIKGITPQSL